MGTYRYFAQQTIEKKLTVYRRKKDKRYIAFDHFGLCDITGKISI